MRMFKRLFSLFLIAALLLGIVPTTAFAQETFTLGADSAEILYAGGRQVKDYFVGEDGRLYAEPEVLVFDGSVANLNEFSGTLFFTAQKADTFCVLAYDGKAVSAVKDGIPGTVKQMYAANGEHSYSTARSMLFTPQKFPTATRTQEWSSR
ncbi:MAG: hypothetical protein MJ085_04660 [Clostridia bacterium]|nr:hypothetical protein [Clostridia bacterium]